MKSNTLPIWDLSDLYSGLDDPKLLKDLEKVQKLASEFEIQYRGKLDNPQTLREALESIEKINSLFSRIRAYAYLEYSTDTEKVEYQRLLVKTDEISTVIDERVTFFRLELLALEENSFKEISESPQLKPYTNYMKQIWKFKPHKLSEKEEIIISKKDITGKNAFVRLYDEITSRMEFEVEIEGKKQLLPGPTVRSLFYHPEETVRQSVTLSYYSKYEEYGKIINHIYNNIVKDHNLECSLRKFPKSITPTHIANQVDENTVDLMMTLVEDNYTMVQEYYEVKAKIMGKEKVLGSDLYAPVGEIISDIPFSQTRDMVCSAYKAFDDEIGKMACDFFDKKWIHAEVRKGKQGGAYCYGPSPEVHPYVLTNYTSTLRDVYTLAHELGHGIHDLLASKQTFLNYHPPLVAAETASVFGEMLLTDSLKEKIKIKDRLLWFYCNKIEDIIATVFRQNMYVMFELESHRKISSELQSAEDISMIWWEEMTKMYGESVHFYPVQKWNWAAIPHFFHYRFYCYAYSFGELFVLCLYQKYKEDGKPFVKRYKQILESGGSKTPYELAAYVGEDLNSSSFWEKGFSAIRRRIEELKEII